MFTNLFPHDAPTVLLPHLVEDFARDRKLKQNDLRTSRFEVESKRNNIVRITPHKLFKTWAILPFAPGACYGGFLPGWLPEHRKHTLTIHFA